MCRISSPYKISGGVRRVIFPTYGVGTKHDFRTDGQFSGHFFAHRKWKFCPPYKSNFFFYKKFSKKIFFSNFRKKNVFFKIQVFLLKFEKKNFFGNLKTCSQIFMKKNFCKKKSLICNAEHFFIFGVQKVSVCPKIAFCFPLGRKDYSTNSPPHGRKQRKIFRFQKRSGRVSSWVKYHDRTNKRFSDPLCFL